MNTLQLSQPHFYKYTEGYATFYEGEANRREYNTLGEAKAAADAMQRGGGDCHAIVFERRGLPKDKPRKYTLRSGRVPKTPSEGKMWKDPIAYLIL
jgi:hypothetical protein